MKLSNSIVASQATATTLARSGVFAVGSSPATDGVIGKTEFVSAWNGVCGMDSITDSFALPALLMPHWFVYTKPFHWN